MIALYQETDFTMTSKQMLNFLISVLAIFFIISCGGVSGSRFEGSDDNGSTASLSVSYNANGGDSDSVPVDDTAYIEGDTVSVPDSLPTRDGFNFIAWNTAQNPTETNPGTAYNPGDEFIMGATDITLYAQWEGIPYTVSYNANGGDSDSVPVDDTKYFTGDTIVIDFDVDLTLDKHRFMGWYTMSDATADQYFSQDATVDTIMGTENIILYAWWKETYSVSYNANGGDSGSVPVDNTAYIEGDTVSVPDSLPTRDGFSFIAWNTAADGSGADFSPGDSLSIGTTDITLYARWNESPSVDAGEDITQAVGTEVSLRGSAEDSEGDLLTVSWSIISKPDGSTSDLVDSGTLTPTLTLDKAGEYKLQLSVSDDFSTSTDLVVIFATGFLPDTGQIISYTDTYGEDSDYMIYWPSYTDNGDGTTTDNNTGLIWEREFTDVQRNWSEAGTYCERLNFANGDDWRLPNTRELFSITYYRTDDPATTSSNFPNTPSSGYWSSDEYQGNTDNAWVVNFQDGSVDENPKTDDNYVRCVRGGQPVNDDDTDNDDGTVTDHATGLTWQQTDDDTTRNWEETLSYCEELDFAGEVDWRLPNIRELESIVDRDAGDPAINSSFSVAKNPVYWSSTTFGGNTDEAWDVNFNYGIVDYGDKADRHYVRCVRDPLNSAPSVYAGEDITQAVGTEVSLSGSAEDPEGDELTVSWEITSKPDNSTTDLENSDTLTPTFTPDKAGDYEVKLSVSDDFFTNTNTVSIYALALPDTGQEASYVDYDDGFYTINPLSYTDNGDETITDNNTGLIWEKEFIGDEYTWSEAAAHCEYLTLASKSDWRLPNTRELFSIVNYGTDEPAIDESYFPDIGSYSSSHWASDGYQGNTDDAWDVNFEYGDVNKNPKTDTNYVRCVRDGETVNDDYTDNDDGTVTDHVTGLIWQQADDDEMREWEEALSYCEGLTLGGAERLASSRYW